MATISNVFVNITTKYKEQLEVKTQRPNPRLNHVYLRMMFLDTLKAEGQEHERTNEKQMKRTKYDFFIVIKLILLRPLTYKYQEHQSTLKKPTSPPQSKKFIIILFI